MSGQRSKHPDSLQNKRGGRYQALAPVTARPGPTPTLSAEIKDPAVRRMWRELWRSPLAGAFKPTDVAALRRWAWWVAQWRRVALEVERNEITIIGSSGPVLNPTIRYLRHCEQALYRLEDSFGMNALARLRLGITLVDNQTKAAQLKQPVVPRRL